jgi:hypothetical protein
MLHPDSASKLLLGAEPTAEALHREDYLTHRPVDREEPASDDPLLSEKAALLRAEVMASVGQYLG